MVSGWCCDEVYRFPHNITYPYFTCISSVFATESGNKSGDVHFKMFLCSLDITDAQLLHMSGNEHINGTDYNI